MMYLYKKHHGITNQEIQKDDCILIKKSISNNTLFNALKSYSILDSIIQPTI